MPTKIQDQQFYDLWSQAAAAGHQAAIAATPDTMYVTDGKQIWEVPEGPCGFAWVKVRPGNCPFANWAKRHGIMSRAYGGGVDYWVGDYDQSMARKEAFARAAAKVLRDAGIKAYAQSRMD